MNLIKVSLINLLKHICHSFEQFAFLRRGGLTHAAALLRIRERYKIYRLAGSNVSSFRIGNFKVECLNPSSFMTLYDEIFLQDAYFFRAKTEKPRIVDCGVNIGLSVLYFKSLYPSCKIVGFEPHPVAFAAAENNILVNGLTDVELIQAAVSDYDGFSDLNFLSNEIMASTLTNRLHTRGCHVDATKVKTMSLKPWLHEHVDFLKLDIEGAEAGVLNDCQNLLCNVDNIFVEGHWTRGQEFNSAASIVGSLEKAGFNLLLISTETNRLTSFQPLRKAGPVSSFIVYGTR